jgi:hypothetical protein
MTQLVALVLSLVVEVPVVVAGWRRDPAWRVAAIAAAATLLSHPLVWHGSRALRPLLPSFAVRATITEVGAWLVEAALYTWLLEMPPRRALAVSLLANAASFGAGLLWVAL